MTTFITWCVIAGICVGAYAYVGYPLLLLLLGSARRRSGRPDDPAAWPTISITLPAYNEEAAIAVTLEKILAADYPPERRQILVISDASSDRTDDIVRGYADRGVELLRMPVRGGKTAAENAARSLLRGDIVVNTDASVRIDARALRPLIAAFGDASVGVASGRDVSVAHTERDVNAGESGYVDYEMWVRSLETNVGSIVGASGCFYAIRRDLHLTLVPEALSRDFAAALIAREHGLRAVSVNEAICYVARIGSIRREYRRKVRTMTRGLETLWFKRHLLNPFAHGLFAWMLFSHKLARWLVPWGLGLAGLGLLAVAPTRTWALPLVAVGLGALVLAAVGWWWPEGRPAPRFVAAPAYVVSGNVAALVAWVKALSGELNPVWEPTRRGTSATNA